MPILYLPTVPAPVVKNTDALFQEIELLADKNDGHILNLFPLKKPNSIFPRFLYGIHQITNLQQAVRNCDLCHVYSPVLHYYPILNLIDKPIVFNVVASMVGLPKPKNIAKLSTLHSIVISNDRDRQLLASLGLDNYTIINTGIDTEKIKTTTLKMEDEVVLLMASAPWEHHQFVSKGIDILLESVQKTPSLKIIFLWRGLFEEKMLQKIKSYGVEDQVELINKRVNISDMLERVHATVLLTDRGDSIKTFPHSLLESLAAGKPIVLSNKIPMADYVKEKNCGLVVHEHTTEAFLKSISLLKGNYQELSKQAFDLKASDFTKEKMVQKYSKLYQSIKQKDLNIQIDLPNLSRGK